MQISGVRSRSCAVSRFPWAQRDDTILRVSPFRRRGPMVMSIESQIARGSRIGSIDVISTRAALGAEVRGVDLKNLDELQFTALKRAWHEYQVILVRDQTLSDQDLIAFSRRFGDLDWAPVQETGCASNFQACRRAARNFESCGWSS